MSKYRILHVEPSPWLGRFRIERASRSPLEGIPGHVGSNLDLIEKQLVDEIDERRSLGSSDGLSANVWLKECCYQIILVWAASGYWEEIEDRVVSEGRFQRGTKKADRDIFQIGLIGLFAQHPRVTEQFRPRRLTDPMWHGFRHYIPPPLLTAFNASYPRHNERVGGWRGLIEPQLEDWVKEQRTYSLARGCLLDEHRGPYPPAIDEVVESALAHRDQEDEW